MTFCHSCDKIISQTFIKKHNKSKSHLFSYNNFVINKYYIGDVLWKDFEIIIRDYIKEYNFKFNSFNVLVNFKIDNKENIRISVDNIEGSVPLYKFKNSGYVYYKFCQSRRIKDYAIHNASLKNINLEEESISDVVLTIFSKYKSIKRNHLLNQLRSILISKYLKQLHNRNFGDKLTKYFYLSKKYGIT